MSYRRQIESILAQMAITPGMDRLEALCGSDLGSDMLEAIVGEAARLSEEVLEPLNRQMDREGVQLVEGRVRTSAGHKAAWDEFARGGWPTLDQPMEFGGQGLPNVVASACEEVFNRGNASFGMLATSTRAAARLLQVHSAGDVTAEWIARLTSGEWSASICISEPDAGSDVGRIRTRAERIQATSDGDWRINGEKMWISFGDHDLTDRIGHLLLARTADASAGTRGLSLFLVPDRLDDGSRNGVAIRRIEEKMGLHGSPTCALGFEDAHGWLVGDLGRGLPQLFRMITIMRLSVGAQGLGIATAASEAALAYAAERRQGGRPDAPPVPIHEHADVQRQLLAMSSRTEVLRGLLYMAAIAADLSERDSDTERREESAALLQFLLPIVKNFGAETGYGVAYDAVLLFGGAGYTREWPVEQHIRDSRVFAVYEGTTGMQALDMLHRRLWRGGDRGLGLFLREARADIQAGQGCAAGGALTQVLDLLEECRATLRGWEGRPRDGEAVATHWLNLCTLAVTGRIALRLAMADKGNPIDRRLACCGEYWLADLRPRAAMEASAIQLGAQRIAGFGSLIE